MSGRDAATRLRTRPKPLATAVIGGILSATLLTLVVIPALLSPAASGLGRVRSRVAASRPLTASPVE